MTRHLPGLLLGLTLWSLAPPVPADEDRCAHATQELVLDRVNAVRSRGLRCTAQEEPLHSAALAWNVLLERAAREQARWLATQEELSHTGPQGQPLAVRVATVGYRHARISENLASGQESVDEAVRAWESSAGHCHNLIDPAVTEMALACVPGADGDPVWVMILGRPR